MSTVVQHVPVSGERRPSGWVRRHPWRTAVLTLLLGFLLLNLLAYQHAGAMLTFTDSATRTPSPHTLSLWHKAKVLTCGVTVPRPENRREPRELGLAAETVRLDRTVGPCLEGWVIAPPKATGTVLLFHGYSACRSHLLEEAGAFTRMGFAAVLVDFRGAGGSGGTTTSLGYQEADDVAAAVKYIHERGLPRPLVLYGQSMGGAAILRSVSERGVRADAVIVESVFGRMLTAVRNRFTMMRVPSFPAAELLVFWGGVRIGFWGFGHNPAEYARACDPPTLVLHGGADRHATVAEGQEIYENLPGDKELVVFDGASHTALLAADPPRWRRVVRQFLDTHIRRESAPQ
ncbi:MAG: alpha/beta fold hydrolase [Gemmataceae bacterium]